MPLVVKKGTGKYPWKVVDKTSGKQVSKAVTKKAAVQYTMTKNKAGYGKRPRQVKGFMRLTDTTAAR